VGRRQNGKAVLDSWTERTKNNHWRSHAEPSVLLRLVGREHVADKGAQARLDKSQSGQGGLQFKSLVEAHTRIPETRQDLLVTAMFGMHECKWVAIEMFRCDDFPCGEWIRCRDSAHAFQIEVDLVEGIPRTGCFRETYVKLLSSNKLFNFLGCPACQCNLYARFVGNEFGKAVWKEIGNRLRNPCNAKLSVFAVGKTAQVLTDEQRAILTGAEK